MNTYITSCKSSDQSTLNFINYGFGEEESDEKDYVEDGISEEDFYNYLKRIVDFPFRKHTYSDKATVDIESKLENTISNKPEQSFPLISMRSAGWLPRQSDNFQGNISYEEAIEHNIIVRMPPKKRYTIKLHVMGIKKAQPKIVEPEEILVQY